MQHNQGLKEKEEESPRTVVVNHDNNPHPLLEALSQINFTQLDVKYTNTKSKESDLQKKINKLEEIRNNIAALPDNALLVKEFNDKIMVAYNQIRFIENAMGLNASALGALKIVKMKIDTVNPPVAVAKAEAQLEPVAEIIAAPKPKAYTPHDMFQTFKELAKELAIKNHQSETKKLVIDRRALNEGRANRRRPPDVVEPMDEPANRQLDYNALERELKHVDRFINALNELNKHQPSPDASNYDNFVLRYNKFAGGINHHLRGMLNAASKLEDSDELQNKIREKIQPLFTPVATAMTEERVNPTSSNSLPAFHQRLLAFGAELNTTGDLPTVKKLTNKLTKLISETDFDVNVQDSEGNTLLHKAVEMGYKSLVTALMTNSSKVPDVKLENNNNETALQLSKRLMEEDKEKWQNHLSKNPNADPTKSTSKYEQIFKLVNPVMRRQVQQEKRLTMLDNAKYEGKSTLSDTITKKYINNFSKINKNLGSMTLTTTAMIAINNNYKHHDNAKNSKTKTHKQLAKSELSKILNPLLAINTVLTFANIGIKVLIDKICNKIANKAPQDYASTPVATILKAVLTFPIAATQFIVGGIGDLISHGVNKIVDSRQQQSVISPSKGVSAVDSLDFVPLDDAPRASRNSTPLIMAATKATEPEAKPQLTERVETAVAAPLKPEPQTHQADMSEHHKDDTLKPR